MKREPSDDLMLCVGGGADGQWKRLLPGADQFVCAIYRRPKITAWDDGSPPDMLDVVEHHHYAIQTFKAPDEYNTMTNIRILMWTELSPLEMFQKLLRGYSPQFERREKAKA